MGIARGSLGAALLAVATLASAPAARAQQAGAVELFGFGQYAKYDDKTNLGSHAGAGGGLGLYLARWLSLEADASYASIGVANGEHVPHLPVRLRGVLNFGNESSSLLAGVGGVRTQFGGPMDTHFWGVSTIVGARIGVGMRGFALRLDGTGDFHPEPKYAVLGARAGVSMRFGGEALPAAPAPPPVLADNSDSDGDGVNDVRDRCPGTARGAEVGASGCPVQASTGGLVAGSAAPQPPQRQNSLPVVTSPRRDSAMTAQTVASARMDSADRAARLRDSVTQSVISRDSAERLEVRRMLEMRQAVIRDSLARVEQARRDSAAMQPAAPAVAPTTPVTPPPAMSVERMAPPPTATTTPTRTTDSAAMARTTTTPARTTPARRDTAVTAAAPARPPAATTPAPAPASTTPGPFASGSSAVLESVRFALAAPTLEQSSFEELNQIAEWLLQNPSVRVEVAGYTDASGRREAQVQLSQARAAAVRDYLVQQGVPAARVTAKGYGPASPRAGNDTPEERARNRRIELRRL